MSILQKIDWFLLMPMVLLLGLSLFMLSSLAPPLLETQIVATLLSIGCFFLFAQLDYRIYQRFAMPIYIVSLIALGLTLLWGIESGGSIRWIPIGPYRFQTSEFIKPLLIVSLAAIVARFPPRSLRNLGRLTLFILVPFFLTFRQPDLGSAIVIAVVWMIILYLGRVRWWYVLLCFLLFVIALPFSWNFLHSYQQERILSFLYPGRDPLGAGYSAIQSQIAIGSGQLFGRGLGRGVQSHLQFLPANTTDFIFASFAEELGFVMVIVVLLIYSFLLGRLLLLARRQDEVFGFLVIGGVMALFFAQVTIHVGMNLGVLPITGITLPFLSYGGSSVVAFGIALGIAASVGRHQRKESIVHLRGLE